MNYYNENEPYVAQWLRNLIGAGLIPPGHVDDRSIKDVMPGDLDGFAQCHFFAGLGGWSRALELAGWHPNTPVWTGSCPCQPFSNAGKQRGFADERHLWPEWFRLIRERRPPVVFGEQVASAKLWLEACATDMETEDYAFGAAVLPACGVGAPHKRDRFWFVSHTFSGGQQGPRKFVASLYSTQTKVGKTIDVEYGCKSNFWGVEPDVGRVAHGIPARVGKLRALGNAIVPQVAAQFIQAVM